MARVFIGMGSNLGDREARLAEALEALDRIDGSRLARASRFYETEPVGGPPQGPYLNAVAELESTLSPLALLEALLAIESAAGRSRDGTLNGPRELDLDLLLYDDQVLETDQLILPHPRLHLRAFVLEPLVELAGDLVHPTRGATLVQLAERVRDPNAVRPWPSTQPKGRS